MNVRKEVGLISTKYIARKYYSSTGAVIEASGDTAQEARTNLKKECVKYRMKPLKEVKGKDFASPGYESYRTGLSVQYLYNPDRRGKVFEAND
jgi:hypothetical protein